MPYTIKKNDDGEFCVHKADKDGEPMGESLGCHESRRKAGAQIGAIEAEEGKKKAVSLTVDIDMGEIIAAYTEKKDVRSEVGGGVDVDKLKDSDFVFPDLRAFPIVTPGDVKDAVSSWGRFKGKKTFEQFKKRLTALAKRKGEKFEAALPKEWNMKKSVKAELEGGMSLEDHQAMIANAWRSRNGGEDWRSHVVECYDDYVIVWDGNQKTHFQVGFSSGDDDINFAPMNEWAEVKLKKEWVAKSLELLGLQDLVVVQFPEQPNEGYAIKTLGGNRIGAYGILWGDESHKDLHKEFFTPDTKDIKAIYDVMGAVPYIVHHGVDDEVKKFVVGPVDVLEKDSKGVWWEAKIKEFEAYREYVEPLLEEEALFSSSGTLPGAKRVNKKTGEITRWPVAEMTGTWLPAEYRMLEEPISDIKSAFQTLGIEFNEDVINVDPEEAAAKARGAEKARLEQMIQAELLSIAMAELENL